MYGTLKSAGEHKPIQLLQGSFQSASRVLNTAGHRLKKLFQLFDVAGLAVTADLNAAVTVTADPNAFAVTTEGRLFHTVLTVTADLNRSLVRHGQHSASK
jgi:hypothetical protein